MTDFDGEKYVAVYEQFQVGPGDSGSGDSGSGDSGSGSGSGDDYVLTLGGFNDAKSTLGNSMGWNNGQKFSTKDRDQDRRSWGNCAGKLTGGWWYGDCTQAHLTGMHTDERKHMSGYKQISYYYGGERGNSYDSWSEAEMLLLPN